MRRRRWRRGKGREHNQYKDQLTTKNYPITKDYIGDGRCKRRKKDGYTVLGGRGGGWAGIQRQTQRSGRKKPPTSMTSESRSRHPASICRRTEQAHIIRPPPVRHYFFITRAQSCPSFERGHASFRNSLRPFSGPLNLQSQLPRQWILARNSGGYRGQFETGCGSRAIAGAA